MSRLTAFIQLVFFSLLLSACGGGSVNKAAVSEPIQLGASSWKSKQVSTRLAKSVSLEVKANNASNNLYFYGYGLGDLTNKHWQIYFDMDNNPATGFQFEGDAWNRLSGIDYIVEDGVIFKSTANDSSWSWKNIGTSALISPSDVDLYKQGQVRFKIDAFNKGLCNNLRVGMITRDKNWNIETFYPVASELLKQSTTFCESNHPPTIMINQGNITLEIGDTYVDAGATATDQEDGDITANIKVSTRRFSELRAVPGVQVDTSKGGEYLIFYNVTDSAGKTSSALRNVTIKKPSHTNGIIIDGYDHDWVGIPAIASKPNSRSLKVTDDDKFLYLEITSRTTFFDHVQFYIDSDNNMQTGLAFNNGAADYMVEDQIFSKFIGVNQNQWAWKDYVSSSIEIATKNLRGSYGRPMGTIMEIAIPKTVIHNLSKDIAISFRYLDTSWNEKFALPESSATLVKYALKYPPVVASNHAPDAVEDVATTTSAKKVDINVLLNDSDSDGNPIEIMSFTQPPVGKVTEKSLNGLKYFVFDPQGNVGSISFSYTISDDGSLNPGHTDTAVVTVATTNPGDVTHTNWPDIRDEVVSIKKGQSILIDVLANDTDADGDVLILDQVDSGSNGTTVIVSGNKVRYTPNVGFTGTDEFWYGVHDGFGHNGAGRVTVTVTP